MEAETIKNIESLCCTPENKYNVVNQQYVIFSLKKKGLTVYLIDGCDW